MTHAQKVDRFMYAYIHPRCDCCCVIAELLDEEWQRVYAESLLPSDRLAERCRDLNKYNGKDGFDIHPTFGQPFAEYLYNNLYI